MTKRKCPPDCTCYGCLEKMANPDCPFCGGDGYLDLPGERYEEALCECTEAERLKRLEKAGIIKPNSTES